MIEKYFLENYALKNETSFRNILREYCQHLFLADFYKKPLSEKFLFKGGTALKLLFDSPRFSEDIDFSALKNSISYEKILEEVLVNLSAENIKTDLLESKPTSGGHLAIISFSLLGEKIELRNEISFRPKGVLERELVVVTSQITPTYKVYSLSKDLIVREKVEALMARQKARDFFDLYFILRKKELRQVLKFNKGQKEKIISQLENQEKAEIRKELKRLLPKSFWHIIKDFPAVLKRELEGF